MTHTLSPRVDAKPLRDPAILVNSADYGAVEELAATFRRLFSAVPADDPINVLAIGSDRTTGDCLGPLVGDFLADSDAFNVYGTLDTPVHAANLNEIAPEITGFTVAIDAALGDPIGAVSVRPGAISPGAAFGRNLPTLGNVSVSALVCESGPLGFERLRSVRLGFVREIARFVADGLLHAVEATPRARPITSFSSLPPSLRD